MATTLRQHQTVAGLAVIMLAVLLMAACSPTGLGLTSSTSGEIALVAEGELIYQANCASCHGPNGEGEPNWKTPKEDGSYPAPPHNADGHTWHHGDGMLFQIIKNGGDSLNIPNFKSNMPAFGGVLTDDEIVSVLVFLKSTWPEEQKRYQLEANQRDPLSEQ